MFDKKLLRAQYIKKRNDMSLLDVKQKSDIIIKRLISTDYYKQSKQILTYVSKGNEVNTELLINKALKDNKFVAVPKVIDKGIMKFYYIKELSDLKEGYYGILEPLVDNNLADENLKDTIIIIPAVIVAYNKNRIGYGGGFYDRYLNNLKNESILKIALVYENQVKENIITEQHDRPVDYVITEKNIF